MVRQFTPPLVYVQTFLSIDCQYEGRNINIMFGVVAAIGNLVNLYRHFTEGGCFGEGFFIGSLVAGRSIVEPLHQTG
jgi:hypothetical protein